MHAYHQHLHLISHLSECIYYVTPALCLSSTSTFLYKPTYKDTSAHHHTKILAKRPSYTSLLLGIFTIIHTSFTCSRKTFVVSFIKPGNFSSHVLSSCPIFVNSMEASHYVVGDAPLVRNGITENLHFPMLRNANWFFRNILRVL